MTDCVEKVSRRYGNLTKTQLKRTFDAISYYKQLYQGKLQEFNEALKNITNEAEVNALLQQRAKIQSIPKNIKILEHILQPNFKGDFVEGMLSLFEGTTRNVNNKHFNIDNLKQVNANKHISYFLNTLRNENLLKIASDPNSQDSIIDAFESYHPSYKDSSNPYERIAHHIKVINKNILVMQQEAGSTILGNDRRIITQTHNRDKILVAPDEWINDMLKWLDIEKTFGWKEWKENDVKEALRGYTESLMDFGGFGEGSIDGGKMEFFFKPKFFKEYNKKWGYRTLIEGVVNSINSAADKAAVHEILGHNPKETLIGIKSIMGNILPGDPHHRDWGKVDNAFSRILKSGDMPGKGIWNNAFNAAQWVKSFEMLTLMGKSAFSVAPDIGNIMLTASSASGEALPVTIAKTLKTALTDGIFGDKKYLQKLVGVALDEMPKDILDITPSSIERGGIHKLIHPFMVLNGMNAITTTVRKTAAKIHAHVLTDAITATNPNTHQKQTLDFSGLTELDIKNLRKIKQDGDLIAPGMVEARSNGVELEVPPDPLFGGDKEKYVRELERKLGVYYTHMINAASSKPGEKEKRQFFKFLHRDHPGRVASEIISFLQSAALRQTNLTAELMRSSNPQGELMNFSAMKTLAQTVVLLTTLKYVSNKAKDGLTKGVWEFGDDKKVAKDIANAALSSGALGIWVDQLAQITQIMGPSNYQSRFPNPVVDHLTQVINFTKSPDERRFQRLLRRSVPFQNLWFIDNQFRKDIFEFSSLSNNLRFLDK